jgi:hypothetical protein
MKELCIKLVIETSLSYLFQMYPKVSVSKVDETGCFSFTRCLAEVSDMLNVLRRGVFLILSSKHNASKHKHVQFRPRLARLSLDCAVILLRFTANRYWLRTFSRGSAVWLPSH